MKTIAILDLKYGGKVSKSWEKYSRFSSANQPLLEVQAQKSKNH